MKVIRIVKTYSSGKVEHHLFLDDDATEGLIDSEAEQWCEGESSGQRNGYSFSWEIVTDKEKIVQAFEAERESIETEICGLIARRDRIIQNILAHQ